MTGPVSLPTDPGAVNARDQPLGTRIPQEPCGPDQILDAFIAWVSDQGLEPYPAQEEAFLELIFWLCDQFGARNVAMLTGDASINRDAPIVCCTTEVLSNMALRQGERTRAPYVVLDEFHYYGDRSRGAAWQIPLLALPDTTFLLMAATLGDSSRIARRLHERTGREVAQVLSDQRPVPLDFDYRETPLHETF